MDFFQLTTNYNIKIVYSSSMILEDIQAVKALLDTPKQIVIIPHVNPDGDAVGSILGLAHYLKLRGKNPVHGA